MSCNEQTTKEQLNETIHSAEGQVKWYTEQLEQQKKLLEQANQELKKLSKPGPMKNGDYVISNELMFIWFKIKDVWTMFGREGVEHDTTGRYFQSDLTNPNRRNIFEEKLNAK